MGILKLRELISTGITVLAGARREVVALILVNRTIGVPSHSLSQRLGQSETFWFHIKMKSSLFTTFMLLETCISGHIMVNHQTILERKTQMF